MTNEKMLELVNSVLNEEGNAFLELVKAKEVLKRDILLECGKKAGKGNLQKVALKILKRSPNQFVGGWTTGGKQYFTDGYIAVCLYDPIPLPEGKPWHTLEGMFEEGERDVVLPSKIELLHYIKLKKAEKVKLIYWDFGEGLPEVDALKLYEILEMFPAVEGRAGKHANDALHFKAVNGKALLLPIRKQRGE